MTEYNDYDERLLRHADVFEVTTSAVIHQLEQLPDQPERTNETLVAIKALYEFRDAMNEHYDDTLDLAEAEARLAEEAKLRPGAAAPGQRSAV